MKHSKAQVRRKDFAVTQIADNTYWINEFDVDCCYLLTGTEKALLIDTGTGLGDLAGLVRELTDLPVTVIATHAHLDHVGGAGQFDQVFVHQRDITRFERFMRTRPMRKVFIRTLSNLPGISPGDVMKDPHKPSFIPIEDGHVFSLGERNIRVLHTPGHTKGSIVLIDDKEKLLFTGDNINVSLFMFMPDSVSIEEWQEGARAILELAKTHTAYCGHLPGRQPLEQLHETYAIADTIIRKHPKNALLWKPAFYPAKDTLPQIVYNLINVHRR